MMSTVSAGTARQMSWRGNSDRMFFAVSALLFVGCAALTIAGCAAMPSMCGLTMPGGLSRPAVWMRMPGQTWPGAVAAFLGMWMAMMAAMMLPSLVPMLWRYRQAMRTTALTRLDGLTARVGTAYFLLWGGFGVLVYALGAVLAAVEMRLPSLAGAAPAGAGLVLLIAGALQFSAWKAYQLECCRGLPGRGRPPAANAGSAWRYGLRLGLHCGGSSASLTAMLLVLGVMDLRVMALATVAITAERVAPHGQRVARAIGIVAVVTGLLLIARAAGMR